MEVTRLFDLIDRYEARYAFKDDALVNKINGEWVKHSATEFINSVRNVSYGLLNIGMQKGDTFATLSNNRPEWNFVDLGAMCIGGIHVPVYTNLSANDLQFIIKDAGIKFIFVSNQEMYDKVQDAIKDTNQVQAVFSFDELSGVRNWKEIVEGGKNNPNPDKVNEIKATIHANDLATLLYTSGTTGVPKGVMLSHNNIVSQLIAAQFLAPVNEHSRALSFLPLNHVYERVLTYLYFYLGVSVWYAESIDKVADNLKEVQPEIFGCVPRLFEKVYDKIVAKGNDLTGVKRKLFYWALELGLKYETNGKNGWWYEFQLGIARKLIFSKWQEALGGKVKAAISGGAALQPRLARVFWAAQIPILEGYGLTETSPVVAVNTLDPGGLKFGTVGKLLDKVTVRIAEDGEILCKGPNLMLGYYNRPDLTAEVIDSEGWFHTGDIGMFEENVYLKITDRKKEIFKTSGGKYIVPQATENKLKESRFIEQVMVVGEGQKFAAAFIVPAIAFINEWAARKGITLPSSREEICKNETVIQRIQKEVDEVNATLGNFEAIKKFALLPREWTVEGGELSPKLSLKRRVILSENQTAFNQIYSE
jgi:long-chain acyl-CoA synthetase